MSNSEEDTQIFTDRRNLTIFPSEWNSDDWYIILKNNTRVYYPSLFEATEGLWAEYGEE